MRWGHYAPRGFESHPLRHPFLLSERRRYNLAAMSADGTASGLSRFFAELKRRNVVRVALVYLGTAWLIVNVGIDPR